MKFGKTFESVLTVEWRDQYMDYALLKALIKRGVENVPEDSDATVAQLRNYYENLEREFLAECEEELKKVSFFFQEKLAEANRKHAMLKVQLVNHLYKQNPQISTSSISPTLHRVSVRRSHIEKIKPVKINKLRFAFSEFYLSLILLQNFQALNYTGFRKICKKYDKYLRSDVARNWFWTHVDRSEFNQANVLNQIVEDVEAVYTKFLAGGDRSRAMEKLRVPPLGEPTKPFLVFRSGFSFGIFIVLGIVTSISIYSRGTEYNEFFSFLFRGPLTWVVFNFFMALNIIGFQHFGVNYILIFEIDPRNHLQPANYLEMASLLGIISFLAMLGFLHCNELNVDAFIFPMILILLMFVTLINPVPVLYYSSRMWLLRILGRLIAAPFFYVNFADFWLGDQLNSLVTFMVDLYFTMRFYVICWAGKNDFGTCLKSDYFAQIARVLPAWFRFAQCLRRFRDSGSKSINYLINAGKYASSFVVVFFTTMMHYKADTYAYNFENPFLWGFLISTLFSTIYCYCWDVLQDFSLFQVWSGPKLFLRKSLVYPTVFYYFVIIENLLIRFFWAIEFWLNYRKLINSYHLKTIGTLLEILRRFLWNYVRLENEHLNNVGRFRATRDIFLSTLNPADQKLMERMMDTNHGVTNRQDSDSPTDDHHKDQNDMKTEGIDKIYF